MHYLVMVSFWTVAHCSGLKVEQDMFLKIFAIQVKLCTSENGSFETLVYTQNATQRNNPGDHTAVKTSGPIYV
jgi:hypothetical protein